MNRAVAQVAPRVRAHSIARWALACALGATVGACTTSQTNPSFDVSVKDAARELRAREAHKVKLERPLVVLAGYFDPGMGVSRVATLLRRAVEPADWVIEVPFFSVNTWESSRARVIAKVINRFGADADGNTRDVDIVAFSMGGLVARLAAMEREGEPSLHIVRLFTISTPHQGAMLAERFQPDERVAGMRAGSEMLCHLDAGFNCCGYEIVSYGRLDDSVIGIDAARGPDGRLWWVPNKPLSLSHVRALYDERILGDIVRRLAGESPWTTEPCAPLPGSIEEPSL